MSTVESEARRALNRLRRAVEKGVREMDALEGALRAAEGDEFPEAVYGEVRKALDQAARFCDEEGARLQEKILHAGGLEAGRIRRSSAR